MEENTYILFVAAVIPMIIGAIYFHPSVMGKAWMKSSGVSEEKAQSGNMLLIFGLAYFFSLLIAVALSAMAIHQKALLSLFATQPGFDEAGNVMLTFWNDFMAKYGDLHRSFGHGAFHGGFAAVFFALPLISIIALFERRGWKYVAVHFGYWFISLILMTGVISHFM